jgi:hypothetical protein
VTPSRPCFAGVGGERNEPSRTRARLVAGSKIPSKNGPVADFNALFNGLFKALFNRLSSGHSRDASA